MTSDNRNHPENDPRNPADQTSPSADRTGEGNDRQLVDGGLDEQIDATRQDAAREAGRLGGTDTFLVDQDMEDVDQREAPDGPDGRPSPLANADNAQR
jgi:hypothetical protein